MDALLRKPHLFFPLFILLSMLFICLLHYPSINAYFVLDDFKWLEKVPLDKLISFFYGSWGHAVAYRPIMRVSFSVDYLLFGENPLGWHLHSYFIHACNATFLFLIIRILTRQWQIAGLTCLFFLISPLGYENVVWISARVNAFGSFFYLSGLYFYLKYMLPGSYLDAREPVSLPLNQREKDKNKPSALLLLTSFILFSLGLLTYEAVVSFPLLLGLLFITHGNHYHLKRMPQLFIISAFACWLIAFLIFRYFALGKTIGAVAGHWPNYFYGLTQNIPDLINLLYRTFRGRDIIVFLFIITLVFILIKKQYPLFKQLLFLVTTTLILYLPFSMVSAVVYRFMYMVQIPYLLLIAGIFFLWLNTGNRLIRYTALILILAVAFSNVKRINKLSNQWHIAGNIAKTIPMQIKELYPQNELDVDFAFHNIPDTYKHAGVFLSYFQEAVTRKYTLFNGKIFKNTFIIPEEENRRIKYFKYDEDEKIIKELSKKEWTSLYLDREMIVKTIDELAHPKQEGTPWDAPGNIVLDDRNLMVFFDRTTHSKVIEASLDAENDYLFYFYKDEKKIGQRAVDTKHQGAVGLTIREIEVPEEVWEKGYDQLMIIPAGGDSLYSLGHLKARNG